MSKFEKGDGGEIFWSVAILIMIGLLVYGFVEFAL